MSKFREMRYTCSIPLKVHVNNAPQDVEITGFNQAGASVRGSRKLKVGDDLLFPLRSPALRGKVVETQKGEAAVSFLVNLSGTEIMSLRGTDGCRPIAR